MARIEPLPPHVVNQIAAGEVIERPASVVKELVENALDAGATRVDVTLQEGGLDLIRVADNGSGIEADQLPMAVASHATSKLRNADDLFSIHTLGFRGEALASIAAVSHLHVRSRRADADAGAELEVVGGQPGSVAPCGCPVGTVVEVRRLFFNTPVRRKYLRTAQTELSHANEALTRLALAHPQIHFRLQHGERTLYDLPPVESWRERIATFFGRELAEHLIWVESEHEGVRLTGYVATPNQSRGNNRMQYLFLNGRPIRDRSLQHALGEAYRGLLMTGRYPIAFLHLEMAPEAVDVNVHPTKMEVRFQDGRRLYSQLLGTLRNRFLTTDLTARVGGAAPDAPDSSTATPQVDGLEQHLQKQREWVRGAPQEPSQEQTRMRLDSPTSPPPFRPFGDPAPPESDRPAAAEAPPPAPPRRPHMGLQLHNRYLVTESDEGMMVIDQHALHERVIYEQLRERVMNGTLESQQLLVPEPVNLSAAEVAALLDAQASLATLGIEIQPFGGDTILISAYPAMLANMSPAEVLRQVVHQLMEGRPTPDRRELLDDLLHMIACKAAVKAGDRLGPEEIDALLEQRHLFQDTHHCPHGRPTALVFTREELDRRFKRI